MPGERRVRAVALATLATLVVLGPPPLLGADTETGTVAPFDPSTRGNKKYGDTCSTVIDCSFEHSVCDGVQKTCRCHEDYVSNHVDKCGRPASINESCTFNQQCEDVVFQTECKNERCACMFEMVPEYSADGTIVCKQPLVAPDQLSIVYGNATTTNINSEAHLFRSLSSLLCVSLFCLFGF